MATVNPPAEQAADLIQKLSLDSQTKPHEAPDVNKKPGEVNVPIQSTDRSTTPTLPREFFDQTMCYVPGGYTSAGYYYGGYDGATNEWDGDYSRYVSPDGSGLYGDNASLMYGYGYQPYGPYSPTLGSDGQLYGPQQYQYPTPYYQSGTPPPSVPYTPNQTSATQGEGPKSVASDQSSLPVEGTDGNVKGSVNGNSNSNGPLPLKASNSNTSLKSNLSSGKGVSPGILPSNGYQDPRYIDAMRSPIPWTDNSAFTGGQHRQATSNSISSTYSRTNSFPLGSSNNLQHLPNLMGLQHQRQASGMGPNPGYVNRMYQNNRFYGQYGATARTGGFDSNGYDYRTNGRGWFGVDNKYKPKGRSGFFGYGNENMDGFNELSRGPRTRNFKNQKGDAPVTLAVRGQNIPLNVNNQDKDNAGVVPDREQYNREDFPVNYTEAKFFIIKSYSEDDVHKSVKYSVWASTPNGNKKLDAAYQEAQEKTAGCPIFLFFSVNTSGQFVGLAEMVGPVDFDKTLDYWQQDKWNGCFPLKWHVVKDVPNSLLKHITLENNDNKPVTNSRDTQEVKFDQGIQMLKIFKDYSSKACVLDDFAFYESRQKTVQEKKAKQLQFQKQVREARGTDASVSDEKEKGDTNGNGQPKLQNSSEDGSAVPNQAIEARVSGESKLPGESELVGETDAPKGAKPALLTENRAVNGVANGF